MLALGTVAPDFKLSDTGGRTVSLADFKDQPALLVMFICNHCPYVKHIRAELAHWAATTCRAGRRSWPSVPTTWRIIRTTVRP